jgi:hypothetical protein
MLNDTMPEHVKEERAVVGRRADVERVGGEQRWQTIPAGDRRESVVDGRPRALDDVELQSRRNRLERVEISGRERIPRDEDSTDAVRGPRRRGWRRTHDGEVIPRPGDPESL